MDPQSQSFTPYSSNNDTWRLQTDVVRVQQIQAEHAERIARLERRQDDDARMKSVWGTQSPFPSVLSGTPQQGKWKRTGVIWSFVKLMWQHSTSAATPSGPIPRLRRRGEQPNEQSTPGCRRRASERNGRYFKSQQCSLRRVCESESLLAFYPTICGLSLTD